MSTVNQFRTQPLCSNAQSVFGVHQMLTMIRFATGRKILYQELNLLLIYHNVL